MSVFQTLKRKTSDKVLNNVIVSKQVITWCALSSNSCLLLHSSLKTANEQQMFLPCILGHRHPVARAVWQQYHHTPQVTKPICQKRRGNPGGVSHHQLITYFAVRTSFLLLFLSASHPPPPKKADVIHVKYMCKLNLSSLDWLCQEWSFRIWAWICLGWISVSNSVYP